MVIQGYEYTEKDYTFYRLCSEISKLSVCSDKKVGSAIVTYDGKIGLGYNKVASCNDKCNKTCEVLHAEEMALKTFEDLDGYNYYSTVYINLFPCLRCQQLLEEAGVSKIVVFGQQGNKEVSDYWTRVKDIILLPNLPKLLLEYNGAMRQRQIVQGELAELITAISNYDSRDDRPESKGAQLGEIHAEAIDVELQMDALHCSLPLQGATYKSFQKWNKLIAKFSDKFFPGKEL